MKTRRKMPHIFTLIGARAAALAARNGNEIMPDEIAITVWNADRQTPLRLQELLDADDGNFAHDVFGIWRHYDVVNSRMRGFFMPRFAVKMLAILALVAMAAPALAQQRTIYDSRGNVVGRVAPDSQGSTTIYDKGGRVTGRTSTDSQGTTTIYDPAGRSIGRITGGKK